MRHGSLFSGIGGFDLAATWMRWENVFQCEKDRFCRRVLQYYWPKAELYEEARECNAIKYRGVVDVISGGFPCQPFSLAGRKKGTADDRYLWPEMYRIIGEVRPRWVVAENVPGLFNCSKGLVFEQVLADLETEGYEAWAVVLPAAGVGAPHRRDRIWFIAHADIDKRGSGDTFENGKGKAIAATSRGIDVPDTNGFGFKRGIDPVRSEDAGKSFSKFNSRDDGDPWKDFPTQPPLCHGNDGVSVRLDGISFSRWRKESIRGAGNAIVPQVAYRIFRAIVQAEKKWDGGIEGCSY